MRVRDRLRQARRAGRKKNPQRGVERHLLELELAVIFAGFDVVGSRWLDATERLLKIGDKLPSRHVDGVQVGREHELCEKE